MSVYCQFYDNKQNKISEVIVSNASISIPSNAVAGLFYDNTYKLDGLKLTLNNLTANDFSFDFAKDYFLYVFPAGYSSILATSVRSSSLMSDVPELSQNDIDYLKNLSDNSTVDLSSIVTALNSITSALSVLTNLTNLTNLSNLADLANIITAINNKDNQSNIVDELRYIFTQNMNENSYRKVNNKTNLSLFKGYVASNLLATSSSLGKFTLFERFTALLDCLNLVPFSLSNDRFYDENNYYLNRILRCLTNVGKTGDVSAISSSSLFSELKNIETKLEQNLPFTTIVNNDYIDNCVSASVAYNKKIENIPFN